MSHLDRLCDYVWSGGLAKDFARGGMGRLQLDPVGRVLAFGRRHWNG